MAGIGNNKEEMSRNKDYAVSKLTKFLWVLLQALHLSVILIHEKALSESRIPSSNSSCLGGYSKVTSTEKFECVCAEQQNGWS